MRSPGVAVRTRVSASQTTQDLAGKEEETPRSETAKEALGRHRLIVIGGGLASARAIESYRQAGGDGRIALISRDDTLPYHRPPLSKRFLRGEAEIADTLVEGEEFYVRNDVDVILETTVRHVDTRERKVETEGGRRYGYEQLVIASGATPRRLEVPGADLDGIFMLRTLAEATAIRKAAASSRDALVVGGGFIGMEIAASLQQLGLEVSLVHRESRLFQHVNAPELEHDLASLLADNRVDLVLADEVAAFGGRSHVDSIETAAGRTLVGDFVVVGVGVEPVVDFLAASGVELDNGVVVNERFETNVPGVYAVGDVAAFFDPLYKRRRRIEHWSNANYHGTEVGKILAGAPGGYDTVSSFFTEIFGVTLKVVGDVSRFDEVTTDGSLRSGSVLALYGDRGRFVGAVTVGQTDELESMVKDLIAERAPVGALHHDLVGERCR